MRVTASRRASVWRSSRSLSRSWAWPLRPPHSSLRPPLHGRRPRPRQPPNTRARPRKRRPHRPGNEQVPHPFLVRGNYRGASRHDRRGARRAARAPSPGHPLPHRALRLLPALRRARLRTRRHQATTPRRRRSSASPSRSIAGFSRPSPASKRKSEGTCADVPYQPARLSGLRTRNTFHNHEVSNHVYGIAIDIDPDLNTCCGCTRRWRRPPAVPPRGRLHLRADGHARVLGARLRALWLHWLGHDALQDTMHFEFLANPEQILRETSDEPAATE